MHNEILNWFTSLPIDEQHEIMQDAITDNSTLIGFLETMLHYDILDAA